MRRTGVFKGEGNPEGVFEAGEGSIYTDIEDPTHPIQYTKVSGGYTSTGWKEMIAT